MAAGAVLDTNAWLDVYLFRDAGAAVLTGALARGELAALRSPATDAEIAAVLQRREFARRGAAPGLLDDWRAHAREFSASASAPWTCRDPDDQKFLDLAVASGAAWLFTKDRALLSLARKARTAGLSILTPLDFSKTRPASFPRPR